jgi:hypothetical protein
MVGELQTRPGLDDRIARVVSASFGKALVHVEHSLNAYASRNGSGIATCTFGGGESASVFWKLGAAKSVGSPGRLGCVGYELDAYREIAKVGDALAPEFLGGDVCGTDVLLVTQYIGLAYRVQKSPQAGALERAVRRIGAFHEKALRTAPDSGLDHYDAEWYAIWAQRASRRLPRASWLTSIADAFPSVASELQTGVSTVIHGEFYPDNVLVSPGRVTAVDWEWAGIGMGEIDLAALTEGWWDEATVGACTHAYAESRGINPADALFRSRFAAARLYLHLRWLGGRALGPMSDNGRWRLEEARSLGAQLGLLPTREFRT